MSISSASFNERLLRIEAERRRTKGRVVLHVGAEEVMVRSLDDLAGKNAAQLRKHGSLLRFPFALAIGALAFAASVALRARFLPLPAPKDVLADMPWLIGLGLGLALALVVGPLLGLRGMRNWSGLALGVVLASATLHNLAFWAPDKASLAFTPDWVHLQQVATAPDSIVFRAQIYVL